MADSILVVDYRLGSGAVANPDGTLPATAVGAVATGGPGPTPFGIIAQASHFASGAYIAAALDPALFDPRRFCVRLVVRATGAVAQRANLFESSLPAVSIHLLPPEGTGDFQIAATVNNVRNGWSGADTTRRGNLQVGNWYAIDVAYDSDTLAVLVDGTLEAVTAFPRGTLVAATSAAFVLGLHPDLDQWPFAGDIALLHVHNGIPPDVEQKLDEARASVEWEIRLKENTLLPGFPLGLRQGAIRFDLESRMHLKRFEAATIAYGTGYPAAHVMHGAIRERWERAQLGRWLGVLVSDEMNARAPGSRRSVFERGVIYWSNSTGAWEIFDRPYIDNELRGGSVSTLGLPVGPRDTIAGGTMQSFQNGRLFQKDGTTRAYDVHGEILAHYLGTGGPAIWGFPTADEDDVLRGGTGLSSPPTTGARQQRFESATLFWSAATGAHEVHGAILDAYEAVGGPRFPNDDRFNGLGLPVTDEAVWPKWAGSGRYSLFEHGSIVWNNVVARICLPFKIKLGLVQTKEDEGWGQGENDLFFRVGLTRNGVSVFSVRIPERGAFQDDNSRDLDYVIDHLVVPNDADLRIGLSIEVWEEDHLFGFADNKIGAFSKELNIANGWGLLESSTGVFDGRNGNIERLAWYVEPRQPPSAAKDFWETGNPKTPNITYAKYAAAFTDIDDDPEWTDPSDWAQREVFARLVKDIAARGNCFGISTEALYAWFGRGYGLPLSRFTASDWSTIRDTVNIKQVYWLGSDVMAHRLDQMEDKMRPVAIFLETYQRSLAGDPCVICMWSAAEYGGDGHSVVPIAWNDQVTPWVINAFDPNSGNVLARIEIDPNTNTFAFNNAGVSLAGSMAFVPWSALNHRQCSPAWDPNMLLLSLLLIVVMGDATTTGITDSVGDNLWLPWNPGNDRASGRGQFTTVPAVDGWFDGEILLRRVRPPAPGRYGLGDLLDLGLRELQSFGSRSTQPDHSARVQPLPRRVSRAIEAADLPPALANLTLRDLLNRVGSASAGDDALRQTAELSPAAERAAKEVSALADWFGRQSTRYGPDFVHHLRGARRGRFDYLSRWRLTATHLRCAIDGGETHRLEALGLAGRIPLYRLTTGRDKTVDIEHTVRLGRTASFSKLRIGKVPVRDGYPVSFAVRGGLSAVDVLTAGEPADVPVEITTWRAGGAPTVVSYTTSLEGGLRLVPSFNDPGRQIKAARIQNLFGAADSPKLLNPL